MATKVMMEALSPTMEEGRLVKWVKNVGDAVKTGDTIGEVETDKAIMELVARGDGILRAHLVPEGTTAAVGMVIGVIAAANEDISAMTGGAAPAPAPAAAPAAAAPAAPAPAAAAPAAPVVEASGPVRSSPLARRMAAEKGVNIGAIHGSGPNGRVIRRDIEAASVSTTTANIRMSCSRKCAKPSRVGSASPSAPCPRSTSRRKST